MTGLTSKNSPPNIVKGGAQIVLHLERPLDAAESRGLGWVECAYRSRPTVYLVALVLQCSAGLCVFPVRYMLQSDAHTNTPTPQS
jgi:hypothetical protein